MEPATAAEVAAGDMPKGDVVSTARIAGIQAAKRTAELIPLCHPLPLSYVDVPIEVGADAAGRSRPRPAPRANRRGDGGHDRRSVAALTVYDMVKGIERGVEVARSSWRRPAAATTGTATALSAAAACARQLRGPRR